MADNTGAPLPTMPPDQGQQAPQDQLSGDNEQQVLKRLELLEKSAAKKEDVENYWRRSQGLMVKLRDSMLNEVSNVDEFAKRAKDRGIEIPESELRAMKQDAMSKAIEKLGIEEPQATEQRSPEPEQPTPDPIQERAMGILYGYGVGWDANHPAAKIVMEVLESPNKTPEMYLDAVREYAKQVGQSRTEQPPQQNNQQQPSAPAGRAPTNLGAAGQAPGDRTAYEREVQEAVQKWGPGSHEVLQIRQRWRKKGLNV